MSRIHIIRRRAVAVAIEDGPRPNPVSTINYIDPEKVSQVRRLDCALYNSCLNKAADFNWIGFTCRACVAYVRMSDEEMIRQGRQIASAIRRGA